MECVSCGFRPFSLLASGRFKVCLFYGCLPAPALWAFHFSNLIQAGIATELWDLTFIERFKSQVDQHSTQMPRF